jgi:hypothetical protein
VSHQHRGWTRLDHEEVVISQRHTRYACKPLLVGQRVAVLVEEEGIDVANGLL